MDKASKWFRSILGLKRRDNPPPSSKRHRSSVGSYRQKDSSAVHTVANSNANGGWRDDPADHNDKHAIAAAVVRLTGSSGGCGYDPAVHGAREESSAVKIQSTFRGYLARRALRALKGLVKLQALVRGHIERKRTIEWLRKMQALLQAQAHARAGRSRISEHSRSSSKSSHFHCPVNQRNGSKLSGRTLDNYEHIDEHTWVQRVHSTRIEHIDNEQRSSANTNSPSFYSTSTKEGGSKRCPFTPVKSDGSTSYISSSSDHPNYMSYTESSRAKTRSLSAPKLRPQHDGSNSTKRYSIQHLGELKPCALKSALHANFACKAYPGSGRLDRLGMPVEYRC